MNYKEALARTLKLQEYAAEYNHKDIQYIVVPAAYQEMEKFLKDYKDHKDPDCRQYSVDGNFSVYRTEISPDSKTVTLNDFANK